MHAAMSQRLIRPDQIQNWCCFLNFNLKFVFLSVQMGAPGAGAVETPLLLELRLSLGRGRKELRTKVAQRQLSGDRDLTRGTHHL
jgi:hypothetical protein